MYVQLAEIQDFISADGFNKFGINNRIIFLAYLSRIFIPEILNVLSALKN